MKISRLEVVYGLLALIGLVATWAFNIRFMQAHGSGLWLFIEAAYANAAAASLANDVTVAAIAFMLWSFFESRRLGMTHWWRWPVLTCVIALAFAFPLFLLLRERALRRQA